MNDAERAVFQSRFPGVPLPTTRGVTLAEAQVLASAAGDVFIVPASEANGFESMGWGEWWLKAKRSLSRLGSDIAEQAQLAGMTVTHYPQAVKDVSADRAKGFADATGITAVRSWWAEQGQWMKAAVIIGGIYLGWRILK